MRDEDEKIVRIAIEFYNEILLSLSQINDLDVCGRFGNPAIDFSPGGPQSLLTP